MTNFGRKKSQLLFEIVKGFITMARNYFANYFVMKLITKNKRAYFDYQFEKDYQAGIILA